MSQETPPMETESDHVQSADKDTDDESGDPPMETESDNVQSADKDTDDESGDPPMETESDHVQSADKDTDDESGDPPMETESNNVQSADKDTDDESGDPQWKQRATTYNLRAPLVQETDNAMTSGEVHNESDMATEDRGRLIIDETPSLAPEQQTNDTEQEIESMNDQDPPNPKIQTKTQTPQSNFS